MVACEFDSRFHHACTRMQQVAGERLNMQVHHTVRQALHSPFSLRKYIDT